MSFILIDIILYSYYFKLKITNKCYFKKNKILNLLKLTKDTKIALLVLLYILKSISCIQIISKQIVSGSNDTIICVWNLDSKGRVFKFLGHRVSSELKNRIQSMM